MRRWASSSPPASGYPARYYDPATGQFLTRDPLVDATGQPYAYAADNPVNFADPLGLDSCSGA